MAQGAHAFKGYVGVGFGSMTDLRAAAVARAYFARFHKWETTHSQGEEVDPTSGRRDPESVAPGNYDVRFNGTLEGTTEGPIPVFARSLMGGAFSDSTTGTTGKQHLLQIADTVPANARLSIESRFGTDAESELINGLCTKLGFNLNQAGYARWDVGGLGSIGSTDPYVASPTAATLPAISTLLAQRVTTFSLDGDTTHVVRNLKWDLEAKVDEADFDVTSRQRRDASYGEFVATFDAELTFQTMVELRRFWGGSSATRPSDADTYYACNISTARSDLIAGGTAKHTAELDLPKTYLTKIGTPLEGRNVIRQRVQGRGIYNSSGSTYSAQLKFINTVASY